MHFPVFLYETFFYGQQHTVELSSSGVSYYLLVSRHAVQARKAASLSQLKVIVLVFILLFISMVPPQISILPEPPTVPPVVVVLSHYTFSGESRFLNETVKFLCTD